MIARPIQIAVGLLLLWLCEPRAATLYVDLNSTNPTPPYATWNTASTDIQSAVELANPGSLILVSDGIYQTGGWSVDGASTNRVAATKALTIQSVHGAAATVIDGGGTVRCAYLADGATLSGFTLTNGMTSGDGGGALCASTNATLLNCALLNNSAGNSGGGAAFGALCNCAVQGNLTGYFGTGGGLSGCVASNCVVAENAGGWAGGGVTGCWLNRCTLTNNSAGPIGYFQGYGGGADASTLEACTVTGNGAAYGGGGVNNSTLDNCLISENGNTLPGVPLNFSSTIVRGNVSATSWDFGDGTVVSNQPAVAHAWAAAGNFLVTFSAAGPDGVGAATSMIHVAASQIVPSTQTVITGDNPSFTILSEVPQVAWQWRFNGTNLPGANSNPLTLLSVATNQSGNYSAVVTLNPPAGYPPGQFPVAVSNAQLTVLPLATNLVLYVDVNSTNPAWPYAAWNTAAITIQDAAHAAQTNALILVNAGIYQAGTQTADGITTNRVTVMKALRIQSLYGSTLTNCLIKNNVASSVNLAAGGATAATLVGCEVIGNTAAYCPGGLADCSASF